MSASIKDRPTPEEFAELRRKRNEAVRIWIEKIVTEEGWKLSETSNNHNDHACYCDCAGGGPCEHEWNGPEYVSEDGCMQSSTCSRCGCTAISHDMRVLP